jgi:hypothetical protein
VLSTRSATGLGLIARGPSTGNDVAKHGRIRLLRYGERDGPKTVPKQPASVNSPIKNYHRIKEVALLTSDQGDRTVLQCSSIARSTRYAESQSGTITYKVMSF